MLCRENGNRRRRRIPEFLGRNVVNNKTISWNKKNSAVECKASENVWTWGGVFFQWITFIDTTFRNIHIFNETENAGSLKKDECRCSRMITRMMSFIMKIRTFSSGRNVLAFLWSTSRMQESLSLHFNSFFLMCKKIRYYSQQMDQKTTAQDRRRLQVDWPFSQPLQGSAPHLISSFSWVLQSPNRLESTRVCMGQLRHPRMVRAYRYLSRPWLLKLRHASLGYRFRARIFCAIHHTVPGFTCNTGDRRVETNSPRAEGPKRKIP